MHILSRQANGVRQTGEPGFSLVELLIIVGVIAIVTAFATMGIARARSSMHLSGAAREYAAYVEKARVDSIRRYAEQSNRISRLRHPIPISVR
jgi:Tfp pilus assembly protein FimT